MKFTSIPNLSMAALFLLIPFATCSNAASLQSGKGHPVSTREKVEILQMLSRDDMNIRKDLKDKELRARAMSGILVRKPDLNGDGVPDLIVTIDALGFCGASGNCESWIYTKLDNEFRYLGNVNGLEVMLDKRKTKGYTDIITKSHASAADAAFNVYKYDGNMYKKSDCWIEEHKGKKIIKHKCD